MTSKFDLSIDEMIDKICPITKHLVRRDIDQALKSSRSKLKLKLNSYFYNDGGSKELLCLSGFLIYQYEGNRFHLPIEIWIEEDHPLISPFAYIKPTAEMNLSTQSTDVDRSGNIILPYLQYWSYPNSDLVNLLKAMSNAFTHCSPVQFRQINSSFHYSTIDQKFDDDQQDAKIIRRDSLQTALLDRIRNRLNDLTQLSKAQIDSLKKTEQDLQDGHFKIESFIQNIQQQQIQAQNYLSNLQTKLVQMSEATQKMSMSSSSKEDAIVTPAPVYKQLLQCYAEEHAIQDLLFYLADGLRRESIGLEIYLKHVRELSRRQFLLRATMQKCRQISGLNSR